VAACWGLVGTDDAVHGVGLPAAQIFMTSGESHARGV
jgi:hypothetical protein